MIKNLLSRLFSRQSREQIIEDPRFRKGEIGTKLMNWQAQRNDPKRFHQPEVIDIKKAEEHRKMAMEHEREELQNLGKKIEPPSDEKILGPSDSREA